MKKNLLILLIVLPSALAAQVKPNLSKAEIALKAGKLDEAKTIIDATVASQDFMVDKKGNPTKNAAEAWYVKGLVYFAIDTTTKEQFKSLDPNPYDVGKDAFEKAVKLEPDNAAFIKDQGGFPMINENVNAILANNYYTKAISAFNEKKDMKTAYAYALKTLDFMPNDTTVLLYAGGVFAPGAGEFDKGLELLDRYNKAGGKTPEVYTMMADIYTDNKKQPDKALEVLKEAKTKFPNYKDIRIRELNIYLDQKKYDVAKKMVEDELKADPTNKDNYFLYAQLSRELGEKDKAKEGYKKVMELDPKNADAANDLAALYWDDAKKIKDEMGALGNKKDDLAKLQALDKQYVEKLKVYQPYVEAAEKLNPDDVTIQYQLLTLYQFLDDQPKVARVKKKLKSLGEDVD